MNELRTRLVGSLLGALLLVGCSSSGPGGYAGGGGRSAADDFDAGSGKPPSAKTLYAMGRVLEAKGQTLQAEMMYVRAVHADREFVPAYCDLAQLQMREGRVKDAIETLGAALEVRPKDTVLLNDLGMCWLGRGDYEQALGCFTEAAALLPENARYRSNMAVALGMQGRYEESLALYSQVLPLGEAYHNVAVLCEARRDTEQAKWHRSRSAALGYRGDS